MTGPIDLVLFSHLVGKPDSNLDLEQLALLIAEAEYPALDIASSLATLDQLAVAVRRHVEGAGLTLRPDEGPSDMVIACVLQCLYGELRFRGNVNDYYDPKNSFLNDVLERRVGIPITLAIVLLSVCRRVGIEAHGVPFPGHFLVRVTGEGGYPLFIDPFDGRILEHEQLQMLYEQATGDCGEIDDKVLEPAGRRQILARMLNNLRAIYEVRGDRMRLQRVLERLAIVNPCEEVRSRLDLLGQNLPFAPRLSVN